MLMKTPAASDRRSLSLLATAAATAITGCSGLTFEDVGSVTCFDGDDGTSGCVVLNVHHGAGQNVRDIAKNRMALNTVEFCTLALLCEQSHLERYDRLLVTHW